MIWVLIVFRTIFQDIFRTVHPRAVNPLEMGDRILPEGVRAAILRLFATWAMVFVLATFLVAIQEDLTPFSSATTVAATLNVVGQGLGQVGASESYEAVNTFGRFVLNLFGRLEIFTALALLSPAFWRKQGGFRSDDPRKVSPWIGKRQRSVEGSSHCKSGGYIDRFHPEEYMSGLVQLEPRRRTPCGSGDGGTEFGPYRSWG